MEKIVWTPAFKRKLGLVHMWLFNEGYTRRMDEYFGWRFKHTLFDMRKGDEQSYRSIDDVEKSFPEFLRAKSGKTELLVRDIVDKMNVVEELLHSASRAIGEKSLGSSTNEELATLFKRSFEAILDGRHVQLLRFSRGQFTRLGFQKQARREIPGSRQRPLPFDGQCDEKTVRGVRQAV